MALQTATTSTAVIVPRWHTFAPERVTGELGTDIRRGLSSQEAAKRLQTCGPNALQAVGKASWYVVLTRQFMDVLIFILMIAAVISVAVGEMTDAATILVIIVLNSALGFVQEWRAEQAIAALRRNRIARRP